MKPLLIKLQWSIGPHYRCMVFVGKDTEHLASSGQLTLLPEEAIQFRNTILQGRGDDGFAFVVESGWTEPE